MSSSGLIALQVIMQSIATGDAKTLDKYLSLLPLKTMDPDKSDSLLARLVTSAFQYNQPKICRQIVDYFDAYELDRYSFPLLNRILMDLRFEDDVTTFILDQYPEHSYLELANTYVNGEADDNVMIGLTRLETIRGPLRLDEYQVLYDQSVGNGERDNRVTRDFFAYQLDQHSGYAPVPQWVGNFTGADHIPAEDELVVPDVKSDIFQLPETTDEIIAILTEGLRVNGKTDEDVELAQAELRKKLAGADQKDKMRIIRGVLDNKSIRSLAENEELFAIFGPVNTIFDDELVNDQSSDRKYGGCRMFTCIEFEEFLEPGQGQVVYPLSEYKPSDWFTGSCQVCHLKIKRYAHAIRLPLDYGGWRGCYCSEKCLRRDAEDNPLVSSNIDAMMSQLRRIGIQDRL